MLAGSPWLGSAQCVSRGGRGGQTTGAAVLGLVDVRARCARGAGEPAGRSPWGSRPFVPTCSPGPYTRWTRVCVGLWVEPSAVCSSLAGSGDGGTPRGPPACAPWPVPPGLSPAGFGLVGALTAFLVCTVLEVPPLPSLGAAVRAEVRRWGLAALGSLCAAAVRPPLVLGRVPSLLGGGGGGTLCSSLASPSESVLYPTGFGRGLGGGDGVRGCAFHTLSAPCS